MVCEFGFEGTELRKVATDEPGCTATWGARGGAWAAEIFARKTEVVIAAKAYYAAVIEEIAGTASLSDRRHSTPESGVFEVREAVGDPCLDL